MQIKIERELAKIFFDLIEELNSMKNELFDNEQTNFAQNIFQTLQTLKKTSSWYIKTYPSIRDFKKQLRKSMRIIDKLLISIYLHPKNINKLNNIREKLEALYVMTELQS